MNKDQRSLTFRVRITEDECEKDEKGEGNGDEEKNGEKIEGRKGRSGEVTIDLNRYGAWELPYKSVLNLLSSDRCSNRHFVGWRTFRGQKRLLCQSARLVRTSAAEIRRYHSPTVPLP